MKDTWKGYALAAITAFLLGGGSSMVYSNAKVDEAVTEMDERMDAVEVREQKNFEILMEIAQTLAEVKVELRYLKEQLDKLD
jgi:hypothetical protein